jgi:YcxB-like protein
VKHYTEDWSKASQNVEIMSDCILYKTLTTRWIAEYRQLLELREIPGAFLLYFDRSSYHLIPKRGFSQKQVDQFRDIAGPGIARQNVSP